jgi:hypothetical protein
MRWLNAQFANEWRGDIVENDHHHAAQFARILNLLNSHIDPLRSAVGADHNILERHRLS